MRNSSELNYFFFHFVQSTSQIITRGATQRAKIQTRAAVNKNLPNNKRQELKAKTNNITTMNNEENTNKKVSITLNEAKRKARSSATKSTNEILVKDIYQNVSAFISVLANGDFYRYQ